MIISTDRQYIFVHIPKTGGTSLAQALEARATADDLLIGDTPKALKRKSRLKKLKSANRLWKHAQLKDIEDVIAQSAVDKCFTFTLVRNPWDRVVSYYHWLKEQNWEHPAVTLAKAVPFADFVRDPQTRAALAQPYEEYMRDATGRVHADLYIRLENMEEDLAPLWAHLGFDLSPIERLNASTRERDYRAYYTDETAQIIAQTCAKDIAQFGYSYD